jgi:Uma2 family endonuclease
MAALITDPHLEQHLIQQRRATGADRYDEVWDGIYVMSPLANNEHQALVSELTTVLNVTVGWAGLGQVFPGVNVSDRRVDWQRNYRCPDVAVFLQDTQAVDCGEFWFGGPELAIEIVSPGDKTLDKLPFYARVGIRELWVVQREPWSIGVYRASKGILELAAASTPDDPRWLDSRIVPLRLRLTSHENRPAIEIRHRDDSQRWLIRSATGCPDS